MLIFIYSLFSFSHLANFFGALKNARIQRSVMREEAHCTDVHRCAQINKSVHLGDGRPVYSHREAVLRRRFP